MSFDKIDVSTKRTYYLFQTIDWGFENESDIVSNKNCRIICTSGRPVVRNSTIIH